MSVNIEDILLLKAQQDAANNNNAVGLLAGGTLGTALGALGGKPRHSEGQTRLLNRLTRDLGGPQQLNPGLHKLRPGSRMAGGLVGLIVGGGLGAGVQQMAFSQSPAARMLAKLQTGGELNPLEVQELEEVLTGTYNSIIGA